MHYNCMLHPEGVDKIRKLTGVDLTDQMNAKITATSDTKAALEEAAAIFAQRAKDKGADATGLAEVLATEQYVCLPSVEWTGDRSS